MTKQEKRNFLSSYRVDYQLYLVACKDHDTKNENDYLIRTTTAHYLATQVFHISYEEMTAQEAEARRMFHLIYG